MSRRRYTPTSTQQPTAAEAKQAMYMAPSEHAKTPPASRTPLPMFVSIKDWVKDPDAVRRDMGLREHG